MTIATCLFCGATKFGALTTCKKCGRRPEGGEEIVDSLALIDPKELVIREQIRQGFREASLRKAARERMYVIYAATGIGLVLMTFLVWYWTQA